MLDLMLHKSVARISGTLPILHFLLHNYIRQIMLHGNRSLNFGEAISIPSSSPFLKQIEKSIRSRCLHYLVDSGFIFKIETRGSFLYFITEHYLALYVFFISKSTKVLEDNFFSLKEKVEEIMRKRPNYENTEEILNACIDIEEAEEKEEKSTKRLALKKPKKEELAKQLWIKTVKSSFKTKALIHGRTLSGDMLSKINKGIVLKHLPESQEAFVEKADAAAEAYMLWLVDKETKVAVLNSFASNFASWMIDGYQGKKKAKGKYAVKTAEEDEATLKKNEAFMAKRRKSK